MALWKENPAPPAPAPVAAPPLAPERVADRASAERVSAERVSADRVSADRVEPRNSSDPALAVAPRRPATAPAPLARAEVGESVIAANLSIEGKIEGTGNVRIAGRFKGDVRIDGNFSIEPGAHLVGQVLAGIVVVGGELQGNIESAKRVDVLEGGVIVGDVKAGSITVAAGSRMRGHVEFGWDDEKSLKMATAVGKA